jgi:hypothetical protein
MSDLIQTQIALEEESLAIGQQRYMEYAQTLVAKRQESETRPIMQLMNQLTGLLAETIRSAHTISLCPLVPARCTRCRLYPSMRQKNPQFVCSACSNAGTRILGIHSQLSSSFNPPCLTLGSRRDPGHKAGRAGLNLCVRRRNHPL